MNQTDDGLLEFFGYTLPLEDGASLDDSKKAEKVVSVIEE